MFFYFYSVSYLLQTREHVLFCLLFVVQIQKSAFLVLNVLFSLRNFNSSEVFRNLVCKIVLLPQISVIKSKDCCCGQFGLFIVSKYLRKYICLRNIN